MTSVPLSASGGPAPRVAPVLALRDFGGDAKRNLLRAARIPQLLLYTVQPILLLIVFRYIFSGAIKAPGGDYTGFVVPAIFLITVLLGAISTAASARSWWACC